MSDSDKKIKLNQTIKKKKEALQGFEDVLDLIEDPTQNTGRTYKKKRQKMLNENFELLNLLEHELERIQKLGLFFNEKMRAFEDFPQTENLITKEQKGISLKRKNIIHYFSSQGNDFNNFFENLYQRVFFDSARKMTKSSKE